LINLNVVTWGTREIEPRVAAKKMNPIEEKKVQEELKKRTQSKTNLMKVEAFGRR
jgi:hypothetical protein